MKHIKHIERNLLCRDGPRLEMSNSIRTDRCGSRTAMVTSLNSIVRSSANAFVETAELATAVRPAGFNGNVRNDCSTVTTNHQMGRSLQHMLFSGQRHRKRRLLAQRKLQVHHGGNAMTDTWNTTELDDENALSTTRYRVLVSRKRFSRDTCLATICQEVC
jgi:hypothetical protein